MAVASSMAELEKQIMEEMRKAMYDAKRQSEDDMKEAVQGYYTGSPKMYKRTGKLKKTPKTSGVSSGAKSIEFDAYLDTNSVYPSITYTYTDGHTSTSKSPSMTDVINLTNYGTTSGSVGKLHPSIGTPGYWEKALTKIEKTVDTSFGKYFK